MPAKKKSKPLTKKEKALNAKIKKELQDEGLIPLDKPRLNRKKFAKETWDEFNEVCGDFRGLTDIRSAIGYMVSPNSHKITAEEIGVFKLMKIAVEKRRFEDKLKQEGKSEYKVSELIEVIKPIWKL